MRFEWDPVKKAKNLRKHGIDFEDAKRVFKDPKALVVENPHPDEERWKITGEMSPHIVVVIFTEIYDEKIRIISARLAEPHEARNYYAAQY